MPWKESSVMEERLRFVARLLDGEGMSEVCRFFGICRKTGYKIFKRYKAHGLEASVDLQIGYPVTSNDAEFESFARVVAGELLGERGVFEFPSPVMGAEDFSFVLNEKPGAMFFLGVRPPGAKDPAPCHSNRMMLDEEGMAYGTALHAAVAMRYLESRSS